MYIYIYILHVHTCIYIYIYIVCSFVLLVCRPHPQVLWLVLPSAEEVAIGKIAQSTGQSYGRLYIISYDTIYTHIYIYIYTYMLSYSVISYHITSYHYRITGTKLRPARGGHGYSLQGGAVGGGCSGLG